MYGGVDYVVKFNDIAFHPVFAGVKDLVIYLDTVVEVNCDTATAYIARFINVLTLIYYPAFVKQGQAILFPKHPPSTQNSHPLPSL